MTQPDKPLFQPRPMQAEVLAYRGGRMGVSAVPGSGKTATLSYLAARLVARGDLRDEQEVLIVTLVKAAVGNFAASMAHYLRGEFGQLPGLGYRVATLHSLANDIVRGRPALAELADDFSVLDERDSDDILNDAAAHYFRTHADALDDWLAPEHMENRHTRETRLPRLITDMARSFIRKAKDTQMDDAALRRRYEQRGGGLTLVDICLSIYEQYERSLRYRGVVDFQDLIRLALRVLDRDPHYLERLRRRYPYVLEDEAQDSSDLQEQILRRLVGENGNWVRVGDPNQAIFETFTTASPHFLRDFLREEGVQARTLPDSGRCMPSIIRLANHLIDWSLAHPHESIRVKQPLSLPHIRPTAPDDPQPNPPDNPARVHLSAREYTPTEEREAIIRSLQTWLADTANHERTAAILTPMNHSGTEMVKALKAAGIPYVENLRSTSSARAVVGSIVLLLEYLCYPEDAKRLARTYDVWRRDFRGDADEEALTGVMTDLLRQMTHVEDFIAPLGRDWLANLEGSEHESFIPHLENFRAWVRGWVGALDLPVEQLVLTLASSIFGREEEIAASPAAQAEVATAYNVASYLARFAELNPASQLPDWIEELRQVALGARKFTASGSEDEAFDPRQHKGKVTVTTLHKAKGLEWDRVHLLSISNYDFPSADSYDTFISESWFMRDKLNMEAEAIAQLEALLREADYVEGHATARARIDYAAERLRLLYVGITRARQELIITWNTGSRTTTKNVEARPLAALRGWWEAQRKGDA